ncbi:MAG: hypothetical protein LBJ37_00070 [Paucimonas sp.]|nr:hypothetical protein [Paucimonas sp.]
MPDFNYDAVPADGTPLNFAGLVNAANKEEAKQKVQKKYPYPMKITVSEATGPSLLPGHGSESIDYSHFETHLSGRGKAK